MDETARKRVSSRGKSQSAINLTERQKKFFAAECERCNISLSELARRIFDAYIDEAERKEWLQHKGTKG